MTTARRHKVLCVDDEQSILNFLVKALSRTGYDVVGALSAEEGLEVLQKSGADLVISDQRMPGMKGAEFLRIVRERYPGVARIMMSGYSDFGSLVDAVNEGEIFRFLPKPCDIATLLRAVEVALTQTSIVEGVQEIVLSVCQLAKINGPTSLEMSSDNRTLVLKIEGGDCKFGVEAIARLLNDILAALHQGEDATPPLAVSRNSDSLSITIDIGQGVTLKIVTP